MPDPVSRSQWKTILTLWALGSLSVLAVFPSIAATAQSRLAISIPPLVFFAGQYLQVVLLLGLAVWLGGRLAPAVGLGAPLLDDWFAGRPVSSRLKSSLLLPAVWGLLAGAVFAGLAALLLGRTAIQGSLSAWGERFLAGLYVGVGEELWLRWFLVTLGLWLGVKWLRLPAGAALPAWLAWTVIALVSLAFGLVRLRGAAPMAWILCVQGAKGLLFGWYYWRRGVEAAVVCHCLTELVERAALAG